MMNTIISTIYHAQLQLKIESDDPTFQPRIMIVPKLAFGPRIFFNDAQDSKETEISITHDTEKNEKIGGATSNIILTPGRNFLGLDLYALMEPFNDQGNVSIELYPDKMDNFVCDIDAPHPGHAVDENGVWTLTKPRLWCKGIGEVANG